MTRHYAGLHLSHCRRFVVVPGPVADGVAFADGTVVVQSRHTRAVEVYPQGLSQMPPPLEGGIEWVDALRPPEVSPDRDQRG